MAKQLKLALNHLIYYPQCPVKNDKRKKLFENNDHVLCINSNSPYNCCFEIIRHSF